MQLIYNTNVVQKEQEDGPPPPQPTGPLGTRAIAFTAGTTPALSVVQPTAAPPQPANVLGKRPGTQTVKKVDTRNKKKQRK